jgi:predicted nucleic acid-binding protein
MIVVSNTSPLTNLAAIGQFDLLHELYGEVHIADGVWQELNAREQRWPGRDEVAAANWIERHTVQNQALVTALRRDLDRGEAETLALALEIGAGLVLLDEREGRHAAQRLELRVAGIVGLLLEAKSRSAVDEVRPHLDALRHKAGFYLADQVYHSALALAGESDT